MLARYILTEKVSASESISMILPYPKQAPPDFSVPAGPPMGRRRTDLCPNLYLVPVGFESLDQGDTVFGKTLLCPHNLLRRNLRASCVRNVKK
jgi:hypothetical protein